MTTKSELIDKTVRGVYVLNKFSGLMGEVRRTIPRWGVEVWVLKKGEFERWPWNDLNRNPPPIKISKGPQFVRETVPGCRVVHRASGYTGEVRIVYPDWGVEVTVADRGYERERWSWSMITRRYPRKIRRFPRPFRFPRLVPTLQCHCKIGKMEVKGEHKVKCLRCGYFIGNEAFPRRFERAEALLRRWHETKGARRSEKKTGKADRGKPRPVKRKANPKVSGQNKKKRGGNRKVVNRYPRRKEARGSNEKTEEVRTEERRDPPVPPNNPVPPSETGVPAAQREGSKAVEEVNGSVKNV